MPNRRIADLPEHRPEEHDIIHMASFGSDGVTRRLNVAEHVCETEHEAIERVKQIYSRGFRSFVMPFKNV